MERFYTAITHLAAAYRQKREDHTGPWVEIEYWASWGMTLSIKTSTIPMHFFSSFSFLFLLSNGLM